MGQRFSDAELAAEWWRQRSWVDTALRRHQNQRFESDQLWEHFMQQDDRLETITRFATTDAFEVEFEYSYTWVDLNGKRVRDECVSTNENFIRSIVMALDVIDNAMQFDYDLPGYSARVVWRMNGGEWH